VLNDDCKEELKAKSTSAIKPKGFMAGGAKAFLAASGFMISDPTDIRSERSPIAFSIPKTASTN
jgi:hypothetical protein